jgi:hypothetical protein
MMVPRTTISRTGVSGMNSFIQSMPPIAVALVRSPPAVGRNGS